MAEAFSENPSLIQVCSNVQLAESLASRSGRELDFPIMTTEQEKACLELLRDRLTFLQKSVQVGLLDRYIRICNKSSASYPPLPITGIKACLYILKVSTEVTDSSIQEKLAVVIENWRLILEQLIGPQIAGLQSIWTSKALCQLSGRAEIISTPLNTSKRKRSLDSADGAHNLRCPPSSFSLTQRPRTSSSSTPLPSISQEITHHLPLGTPMQQTDAYLQLDTPTQTSSISNPPNPTVRKPPANHDSGSNSLPVNDVLSQAQVTDPAHCSLQTANGLDYTQAQASISPLAVSVIIAPEHDTVLQSSGLKVVSPHQGPSALPQSKAPTDSCNTPSLMSHQNTPQESDFLPLSSSNSIVSRDSQPIHPKTYAPSSSLAIDSSVPTVLQDAVSHSGFAVNPRTLNLLNYWQHAFCMLDLAVTKLLEISPLSPYLPLSKASNYYPQAYSPSYQWVPPPVPSYAPPPILQCINTVAVLTPQPQRAPYSLTPQSLTDLDRKPSNDSMNSSGQVKLLTPVSLKPLSPQSAPSTSVMRTTLAHPAPSQNVPIQNLGSNLPNWEKQENLRMQTTPVARQPSQQLMTLPHSQQSPRHLEKPLNPIQSTPNLQNILPKSMGSNQEFKQVLPSPTEPTRDPKKDISILQSSQQPDIVFLNPKQPSQHPEKLFTHSQPCQQLETNIPSPRQLTQKPVLNPSQFILHITEAQKIKFVHTYRRVDATGKAKLEATLRKNNLWEHLSPLLYTTIIDNTNTDHHQASPSGTQSNPSADPVHINSTVAQPSSSSSPSVPPSVPCNPHTVIAAVEKLPTSEISSPAKSLVPPQFTPQSAAFENKTTINPPSLDIDGFSDTSLDPTLSKMIIAMLAPEPQANNVLMAAFDTLGIRDTDAITTHLKALADCFPGVDSTFWKLRTAVEAAPVTSPADSSSIVRQAQPPVSTLDSPEPLEISRAATHCEVKLVAPPMLVLTESPLMTHRATSLTNPTDSPLTPQMTSEIINCETYHSAYNWRLKAENHLVSTSLVKVDLFKPDSPKQIRISADFIKGDTTKSLNPVVDASHEGAETNVQEESKSEIISLHEFNQSESTTPSKRRSSSRNPVSPTTLKTETMATPKGCSGNLLPESSTTVFQDNLPGFPDVDPSIQIQGTPARILARYASDQQMPPFRTFVPLLRKTKLR